MKRRGRDHLLATVLFTDIVGSSRIAAELGDRRWRTLLGRHHAIVRNELKRFRGRELDTAGDGFFAVFDEPSDAIRCACAIADGVRELGIDIRAGLNLGEAEVMGGKLGGMAVHAAARIMALAGPGEVLVASTIKDLVPGSGFTFADRGATELRDIPGAWRLFSVTEIDGSPMAPSLEPEVAILRRQAIQAAPLLQRRSGRIVIGAVAASAIAAAVVVPLATRASPGKTASAPTTPPRPGDRVLMIDPHSAQTLHSIDVGNDPGGIAFGGGAVWVTNSGAGTVSRIDPASRSVRTIKVGHSPRSIAVGADAVWVGDDSAGTVLRIDPLLTSVKTIDLGISVGANTLEVAVDDVTDSVWVSIGSTQQVSEVSNSFEVGRIDAISNTFKLVDRKVGCCYEAALAAGQGSVWFASDNGTVVRYDARTDGHVWDHKFGVAFSAAAVGSETVWLASASLKIGSGAIGDSGGTLTPISLAANHPGDSIPIGGGPTCVAVIDVGVFVSDVRGGIIPYLGGSVSSETMFDGSATGIAFGDGALWVAVDVP